MTTTITANAFIADVVPNLQRTSEGWAYRHLGDSASSFATHPIPMALLQFDTTPLRDALRTPNLLPYLLKQYPILNNELSHILAVEGDVERALYLYIVHTINLILEDFLGRHRPGHRIVCRTQLSKDNSRLDLTWIFRDTALVIVEVKKVGSLAPEDWLPAVGRGNNPVADAQRLVREIPTAGLTALERNAGRIVRQVTKYNHAHNAPIILIFDWAHTVFLDLNPGANNEAFDNVNNFAKFFITDETTRQPGGPVWTHRRLLLASLIHSLAKQGL